MKLPTLRYERGRMRLEVAKTRSEFVAEPRKQQPDLAAEVTTQRQIESGMASADFELSDQTLQ